MNSLRNSMVFCRKCMTVQTFWHLNVKKAKENRCFLRKTLVFLRNFMVCRCKSMNSLRNSMVFLQESGPRNHFLEIQAHDIRLGAIQESMDPAQELWKSIRPLDPARELWKSIRLLGARAQGPCRFVSISGNGFELGRKGLSFLE